MIPDQALPQIRIEASVLDRRYPLAGAAGRASPDLSEPALSIIVGEISWSLPAGAPPLVWVDPLARLPAPQGDLELLRRFPGRPEVGAVTFTPLPSPTPQQGAFSFRAALPRRYGDIGATERGLVANGGWYPQPLDPAGLLPLAEWSARVEFPTGVIGSLNGLAGSGTLEIQAVADRVALSAARAVTLTDQGGVTSLEHGRAERGGLAWLVREGLTGDGAPPLPAEGLLIVEIPAFEQLATAGPGVVFLSERAGRLTGGLRSLHLPALRARAREAGLQDQGGWWAAAEAAILEARALPPGQIERLLGWFSWNPVIDALLTDGTLPFYAETFREPHLIPPGVARIAPRRTDPEAAAGQALAWLAQAGRLDAIPADPRDLPAWLAQELPPGIVEAWGRPWPQAEQNYRVVRAPAAPETGTPTLEIHREIQIPGPTPTAALPAALDLPPELLVVRQPRQDRAPDQAPDRVIVVGPGLGAYPLGAGPIQLDPDGLLVQATAADDRWPTKIRAVAYGWASGISVTERDADLFGEVAIRRDGDTHHLGYLALAHDQQDIAAFIPGYTYAFGPLMDRRYRPNRVGVSASVSLLDPGFRPTGAGPVAVGLSGRISRDTRDEISGYRLGVGAGVGSAGLGGTSLTGGSLAASGWLSLSGAAVGWLPIHPRHVLALRLSGGLAAGQVEHRLLPIGGASGVRAWPEATAVGRGLAVGSVEYRLAALRDASIPLGFGWLSRLEICPGLDLGWLTGAGADLDAPASLSSLASFGAAGLSLSILPYADLLGARPTPIALTVAWAPPGWSAGNLAEDIAPPGVQVYIDFDHPF